MRSERFGRILAVILFLAAGVTPAPASAAVEHSSLGGGREAIYITGDILPGDDEAFAALAARYRNAVVFLESNGGALVAGIGIGKLVRQHRYTTVVLDGSTCTSACALIWLGGSPRYLAPEGRLGFHASYFEDGGTLVETGVGNAIVGHYLSELDLSEGAAVFATSASPYDINWLTSENSGEAEIAFQAVPSTLPVPERARLASTSQAAPGGGLQKARVTGAAEPERAPPPRTDRSAPAQVVKRPSSGRAPG